MSEERACDWWKGEGGVPRISVFLPEGPGYVGEQVHGHSLSDLYGNAMLS